MHLSALVNILNAKLVGEDVEIQDLTTDSTTTKPGDMFIARSGASADGHDYIQLAQQNGALAALVDHQVAINIPQLIVDDTAKALAKLGAWKRAQYQQRLLAVTGSCGKTTTKEMLAAILRECGPTFVSAKSFNNAVGMPLTLWNLRSTDKFAVLELGANHHGEIADLVKLIKPVDVAVITNAEPCHLEGFGNVAGVARAKSEIFLGLSDIGTGTAIINVDSEYGNFWRKLTEKYRQLTFGMGNEAQISAKNVDFSTAGKAHFLLVMPNDEIEIALPHSGAHNVMNALAAAAAATVVGASALAIKTGLENFAPVKMRLVFRQGVNGARIIDDTYNANPSAVKVALEVLLQQKGEKVFVFGGMRELGEQAAYWHSQVGKIAKGMGVDYLFCCGQYAQRVTEEFGANAHAFVEQSDLISALQNFLDERKVVLVKGSRGAVMEKVVSAIVVG